MNETGNDKLRCEGFGKSKTCKMMGYIIIQTVWHSNYPLFGKKKSVYGFVVL